MLRSKSHFCLKQKVFQKEKTAKILKHLRIYLYIFSLRPIIIHIFNLAIVVYLCMQSLKCIFAVHIHLLLLSHINLQIQGRNTEQLRLNVFTVIVKKQYISVIFCLFFYCLFWYLFRMDIKIVKKAWPTNINVNSSLHYVIIPNLVNKMYNLCKLQIYKFTKI